MEDKKYITNLCLQPRKGDRIIEKTRLNSIEKEKEEKRCMDASDPFVIPQG